MLFEYYTIRDFCLFCKHRFEQMLAVRRTVRTKCVVYDSH
jgi:hypothetical protein